MAGLLVLINFKNLVVGGVKNFADEDDLIWVQVPLTDLDLGHGTAGDVAAKKLQLGGQSILGDTFGFSDFSDILADFVLDFLIHNITILHLYWNN